MYTFLETVNHNKKQNIIFQKGKKKKNNFLQLSIRNSLCDYAKYVEFSLDWNV